MFVSIRVMVINTVWDMILGKIVIFYWGIQKGRTLDYLNLFYRLKKNKEFMNFQGDSTIYAYEVGADYPHLFPLSHHKAGSVHQVRNLFIWLKNQPFS